jgi:predicted AlkP superfamily phosphohydrolase/phosphomutase
VSSPDLTVIGLDSATFDVVDPMLAAGELPNLARLCDAGARGVLRSTTHPLTPHAWATIVTGVNAGRHGIWDFTERDETGYQLRLVNGSFRRAPAVWDRLRRSGRRTGIVNVPFTWPAPEVDGFAFAGFDAAAREQGLTYPEELRTELRQRFGSLELDNKFPLTDGKLDLDLVRRAAAQKVEIVTWLADRFDPELLFVVFMAADHIHHLCWTDWEADGLASPVAEVYRVLDEAVGALAALAGADGNVLVLSDHGAGPLHGVVNLNAWLASEGFLAYATPPPVA